VNTITKLTMLLLATVITISPVQAVEISDNEKAGLGIAGIIATHTACEGHTFTKEQKTFMIILPVELKDDADYSRGFKDGTSAAAIAIRADRAAFCAGARYASPENFQ
jgi:hypothetical protein